MRLESIVFSSGNRRYERLASVLRKSAAINSPDTPLTIHEITEPDEDVIHQARENCEQTFIANARKTKHHVRIISEATDGELLCMIDADTMVMSDLSEISGVDFDLAYTVRSIPQNPLHPWKINTGVYFVRASAAIRAFAERWYATALEMLADKSLHHYWCNEKYYGGLNQAALGYQIEMQYDKRLRLLELPCPTWNSVNGNWKQPCEAKIVHIMASLRDWCLGGTVRKNIHEQQLVEQWMRYDKMQVAQLV